LRPAGELSTGNRKLTVDLILKLCVPVPMAYFPFSGWKDSFFAVVHGQGHDGIEFYTEKKVVIERWLKE
jgi:malonate-semialdehyde dehydrogenase (acetylating)/methylmalonate-semialdehyde dehydrogenase